MTIIFILVTEIEFYNICSYIANNDIIIAFCSITSLIGFAMTIYVSLKTKSIDKKIIELNLAKDFNKRRKNHIVSLKSYQTSLLEDKVDINIIRANILNDINIIYESYKSILKLYQRVTIIILIKRLEKEKITDVNSLCNLISKVIAYMSNNKEG